MKTEDTTRKRQIHLKTAIMLDLTDKTKNF